MNLYMKQCLQISMKLSLVVMVSALIGTSAFAESTISEETTSPRGPKGFAFGPLFAPTVSGVLTNSDFDNATPGLDKSGRMGIMAGVRANLPVAGVFSLAPELLYVQRGTNFSAGGVNAVFKSDYLALPVMARFTFLRSSKFRPYVYGGPEVAVRVNYAQVNRDTGVDSTPTDPNAKPRDYDISLLAGGGFEFDVAGPVALFIDARYTQGLINQIPKGTITTSSFNPVVLNSSVALLGGAMFAF